MSFFIAFSYTSVPCSYSHPHYTSFLLHILSPPRRKSSPVVFPLSWCVHMCITSDFLLPSVSSFSSPIQISVYVSVFIFTLDICLIYNAAFLDVFDGMCKTSSLAPCLSPPPPPVGSFFQTSRKGTTVVARLTKDCVLH